MRPNVAQRLPRDAYLAAGARAVSMLGSTVAVTALLLELHDQGVGTWAVAGVLFAGTLPLVLLAPMTGALIDRYDSRLLIVVSGLWQAVLYVVLAFVGQPFAVLFLLTLASIGMAVTNPVLMSLTRLMVPSGSLAPANALQNGGLVIALLTGPAVSGMLVGITGTARLPLLLNAIVFVVISGTGFLIRTRRRPGPEQQPTRSRDGLLALFHDPALAAMVSLAVQLTLVVHLIFVAQVYLVRDTFGASELTFGLLQATNTVGLLIGTVAASRLHTARRIVLVSPLAATVMSIAIIAIGVVKSLPATFALYVVEGFGASLVSVSVSTILLLRTPEHLLGRGLASFTAVHRAAALVAYGLGGWIVGLISPASVFILSGTGALFMVLICAPALRRAWLAN